MHIRLPDRHNVVNHFRLKAFLSEQHFLILSTFCSSGLISLLFIGTLYSCSNLTTAVDIV